MTNTIEIYTFDFKYRFKIILTLMDEGVELLFNQDGLIAHRRKDINEEDEKSYGLHKAVKECNIRSEQQIKDFKTLFGNELDFIQVDLYDYLKGAVKIKRISQERLNSFENLLGKIFKKGYRLQWIIKNGYVLNVFCKDSVPEFLKNIDLNRYFDNCMIPTDFGFIDYQNSIILVDNVNLNLLNNNQIITNEDRKTSYILDDKIDKYTKTNTFYTDNYGRLLVRSSVDDTYRRYIQLNKPGMKINRWRAKGFNGGIIRRLYCEDNTKINLKITSVDFTITAILNFTDNAINTEHITMNNINKKN